MLIKLKSILSSMFMFRGGLARPGGIPYNYGHVGMRCSFDTLFEVGLIFDPHFDPCFYRI